MCVQQTSDQSVCLSGAAVCQQGESVPSSSSVRVHHHTSLCLCEQLENTVKSAVAHFTNPTFGFVHNRRSCVCLSSSFSSLSLFLALLACTTEYLEGCTARFLMRNANNPFRRSWRTNVRSLSSSNIHRSMRETESQTDLQMNLFSIV